MKHLFLPLALCAATATPAVANDFDGAMQRFLEDNISAWASDPILASAIAAQNTETASYDQAMIDELDLLWRTQVSGTDVEMINNVLLNPAADFLRSQIALSQGAITEAFIVDARGLNVAASEATSDYWQGDEAKFSQTYMVGSTAVHFGEIELDESTETVQGQVSMTLVDPETGESIGALTVGINLTALL